MKRDPKAESLRLHRARRAEEILWRDRVLACCDTGLAQALGAIARALVAAQCGKDAELHIREARDQIKTTRMILRAYFDQGT